MPTATARPIRLYGFPLSGHAHRARLFLSLLGLPVELVDVDLRSGAQKQPDFLRLNAFGQVPVIDDDGVVVADSNAILVYLASKYDASGRWLPRDPVLAAEAQRWLSVAAGPLAMGPALARIIALFKAPFDHERAKAAAVALLGIMDAHLATRDFFVGNGPTIADIALYSYTAHAPEGGVALEPYAHIRAWLQRIEALPGFVPMIKSPVPQAAE